MQKRKLILLIGFSLAALPAFATRYITADGKPFGVAQALAACQTQADFYNGIYMYRNYRYDCADWGTIQPDMDGDLFGQMVMWEVDLESGHKVVFTSWRYGASGNPVLTIAAQPPKIPAYSGVSNGKVLTRSLLAMSLRKDGKGAAGEITLSSNRGPVTDSFLQGGIVRIDQTGNVTAPVSTRLQPGSSTITASGSGGVTPASTPVSWLPARYESSFVVTCYTIANEADWPATPSASNVCGLPEDNNYSSRFLQDLRMQGSGVARDGTIIHYNGNQACYSTESCARTATGVCAVPGTTIAVDPTVVPKKSTVSVDILGQRKAQDTGGGIKGYHIDDYVGAQPALCRQLGRRNSGISFSNY